MADTEPVAIVALGVDDAPGGLALSTEARWNQNEADWRFFLTNGVVFGVRDGTHLIATAALLPYSAGNAWISMVLVTAGWRRRGIATRLVDACLDAARRRGLTAWLDATPAGAAVYGPLGFTPTLQLRRLRLEHSAHTTTPTSLATSDIATFSARDRRAMGFERSVLLAEFGARTGSRILSRDSSMALVRGGRTARHIGPLFADDAADALALVDEISRSEAGPILIDAIASHETFIAGLTGAGWDVERPFQRMRFGRATPQGEELPFAVAGPEFG